MKFGLFYNPIIPKQPGEDTWTSGFEQQKFNQMLEQIEFADSLGFEYLVLGEHHFTPEYAHNSAPEVLLGALARTTKNIRLTTGIIHSSHNDPVRTAERAATIDNLSSGRFEYGFGSGTPNEVAPYLGEKTQDRTELGWSNAQVTIDVMASEGLFPGADTGFYKIGPVNVVPKVVQKPHPPLWSSTTRTGVGQARNAAKHGLGTMVLGLGPVEQVSAEVTEYWEMITSDEVVPMGKAVNPAVMAAINTLVAPTREAAHARGREGFELFGYGLTGGSMAFVSDPNPRLYAAYKEFKETGRDVRADLGLNLPQEFLDLGTHFADAPGVVIGSPDDLAGHLRQLEAAHVDAAILRCDFGVIQHEHIMEHLELIAEEVMPEFRERQVIHDEWRAKQMSKLKHPVMTSFSSQFPARAVF